jgi:hypothetical protein
VYNTQQRNSRYSTGNLLSGAFTFVDVLFGLALVFSVSHSYVDLFTTKLSTHQGLLPTMMIVYVGLELGVKPEEITGSSSGKSFATPQLRSWTDVERGSTDETQKFSSQSGKPDRSNIRPQRIEKF